MAWSDIDFDMIKRGSITGGPSQVSFAEYLQGFADACNEKIVMLQAPNGAQLEPIEFDEFTAGQIGYVSKEFRDNYRLLLRSYSLLFRHRIREPRFWANRWFKKEVLTDIENWEDYQIVEDDIIELLGEQTLYGETDEIWDLIKTPEAYPFWKLYTADILHGLHRLYSELTLIYSSTFEAKSSSNTSGRYMDTWIARFLGSYYGRGSHSIQVGSDGNDPEGPDGGDQYNQADDEAYGEYLADNELTTTRPYWANSHVFVETSNSFSGGIRYLPVLGFTATYFAKYRTQDGFSVLSTYTDKDGNFIDVAMYPLGKLEYNYGQDYVQEGYSAAPPLTTYGAVEDDLPKIDPYVDSFKYVSLEPYTTGVEYIDPALGKVKEYRYFTGATAPKVGPNQTPPLKNGSNTSYLDRQLFGIKLNGACFVDINSTDLDWYVE